MSIMSERYLAKMFPEQETKCNRSAYRAISRLKIVITCRTRLTRKYETWKPLWKYFAERNY